MYSNYYFLLDDEISLASYLGKELFKTNPRGKLFTFTAGKITYYSKWESHDFWGLATSQFSKSLIQTEDISKYNPDMIYLGGGSINNKIRNIVLKNNSASYFNKCYPYSMVKRNFRNSRINVIKGIYKYNYELYHYNNVDLMAIKLDSPIYQQLTQIFAKLNIKKIN